MGIESGDFIWLYEIKFSKPRKQIGDCRFSENKKVMTELKTLKIFRHKDDTNVHLLYEFVNGGTDSYLESIEEAMREATEEFGVKPEDWKKLA